MSRRVGDAAEEAAAAYLCAQGFAILERNYTVRGAEIDIIAREGEAIAFVEVRFRSSGMRPRESVTTAKQARIAMAALRWLQREGLGDAVVRFDVVEVTPADITLLRNAFDAGAALSHGYHP